LAAGVATAYPDRAATQEIPPPAMRSLQQAQVAALAPDAGAPALPSLAVLAFSRMGFGPTPGDWEMFRLLGSDDTARLTAYVDQQLNPSTIDDSRCDEILAGYGYKTLEKRLEKLWADHIRGDQENWLPAAEVERSTFLRAIYSKRQLFELMTDHWLNHFNVYAWDYPIAAVFVHFYRDVIRKHQFGNFRAMLEAVAQSPAMLYYLDNQSNSGGKPNENYSRELFELHALGAENYLGVRRVDDPAIVDENGNRLGYVDEDVYGATTCFTGWRVDQDTGLFYFSEKDHFPYAKEVLGARIPASQGIKDGKDVLDLLAFHPGTAHYISRRLCIRLISDNPPESVVQAAADVFIAHKNAPDQLKKVMRTILLSPEFRNSWGEKIKRPFEYSVSVLRALNADFVPEDSFFWSYDNIGQPLFSWRPPDGYPDDREAWSGTMPMLQRWRHANWLFGWRVGGDGDNKDKLRVRPEYQTPESRRTPSALVDFWSVRMLGRPLPSNEREAVVEFMAAGRNPDFDLPADQIAERLRQMVVLICMSPSFQWR
jgi:uncharacterized protein (DUF1800 family)